MSLVHNILGMGGEIDEKIIAEVYDIEMQSLVYTLGRVKSSNSFLMKIKGLLVVTRFQSKNRSFYSSGGLSHIDSVGSSVSQDAMQICKQSLFLVIKKRRDLTESSILNILDTIQRYSTD